MHVTMCYFAVIIACIHGYMNLALKKKTTWQSTSHDASVGSEKAVDGLKSDLSYVGQQCSISLDGQTTVTWWVNLGGILSLYNIVIFYRTDNLVWNASNDHSGRFLGFSVYVSNTTNRLDGMLCFHDTMYTRATIPAVVIITCIVHGQYVIYYNERIQNIIYPSEYSTHAFVELCEVEVYGCPAPRRYGSNCSLQCPTNCKQYCHIESGYCFQCHPGYMGGHCEQQCSTKKYGEDCSQDCGICLEYKQCDHINGTCQDGCDRGYHGHLCRTECVPGQYGVNCKDTCSEHCLVTNRCNHTTGECRGGCKPGWKGLYCDKSKEEPNWQVRFYGVLAALCVCVTVIAVLIVVMCLLQRQSKSGTHKGHPLNERQHPKLNVSYIEEMTGGNVKSEYQELSERDDTSPYDVIKS